MWSSGTHRREITKTCGEFVAKITDDFADVWDNVKRDGCFQLKTVMMDSIGVLSSAEVSCCGGKAVDVRFRKDVLAMRLNGTMEYVRLFQDGFDPCKPLVAHIVQALKRKGLTSPDVHSVDVELASAGFTGCTKDGLEYTCTLYVECYVDDADKFHEIFPRLRSRDCYLMGYSIDVNVTLKEEDPVPASKKQRRQ